jgi:hypothetical protein
LHQPATVFVRKQRVTGSQDDGFVGEFAVQLVGYAVGYREFGIPGAFLDAG